VNLASRPSILRFLGTIAVLSLSAGCSSVGGGGTPAASAPAAPSPSTIAATSSAAASQAATPRQTPQPTSRPTPELIVVADGEAWIAYQGGTGGPPKIRLVRPDGSGDHALAPGILAGDQLHPDWSPDGMRVSFAADDGDGSRDLWTANADGSDAKKAYDCTDPCAWSDDPAWSPDGKAILFQQGVAVDGGPNGAGELAWLDPATGAVTVVYTAPGLGDYLYGPRWAPDGVHVVFEVTEFKSARLDEEAVNGGTIAVVALEDGVARGAARELLPRASRASYPDWHPDGSRIVYVIPTGAGDMAPSDLWTIAPDGMGDAQLTRLAEAGGRALQPTWSPDGTQLVLVAEREIGTPAAGITAADGTGLEIVPGAQRRTHPRLRPLP
jgi:Tol biopolymer transport system component